MGLWAVCLLGVVLGVVLGGPASAAAGPAVSGRVVDDGGRPLVGAKVELAPLVPRYETSRLLLDGQPGAAVVRSGLTDAKGRYRLVAPDMGMWRLTVSAEGRVPMQTRLVPLLEDLMVDDVAPPIDVGLDVRVVHAGAAPLDGSAAGSTPASGAAVAAYRIARPPEPEGPRGVPRPWWHGAPELATVDGDGSVRLASSGGVPLRLQVLAPGAPQHVVDVAQGARSHRVVVPGGTDRRLLAVDGRGRPLAGVVVGLGRQPVPLGITDADGRMALVLPGGAEGQLQLASAKGHRGTFGIEPDGDGDARLVLENPRTLRGRVLDKTTGTPVPDALVWPVSPGEAVLADRGGWFEIVGVGPREWLTAAAVGFFGDVETVIFRDGEPDPSPTLQLLALAGVEGRVLDLDGEGVAGAKVGVWGADEAYDRSRDRPMGDVRTDSEGRFKFPSIPAGFPFFLRCQHRGFVDVELQVPPLEPKEVRRGLEMLLEPGRDGVGRVVDEDDRPVVGAEVALTSATVQDAVSQLWGQDTHRGRVAVTDGEGRFVVPDLAVGDFDLRARARGFAPATVPGIEVRDEPGPADLGTLVLMPGAEIRGRVVDAADRPLAEVRVDHQGLDRGPWPIEGRRDDPPGAVSNREGRFTIPDLAPGQRVMLQLEKEGYVTARLSAAPAAEEPQEVVVEAAVSLAGRAIDEAGEPLQGVVVMASDARPGKNRMEYGFSDAEGAFEIDTLAPGIYQVQADRRGYRNSTLSDVEVTAEGAFLEVTLRRGATLVGWTLDPSGAPLPDARISVEAPAEQEQYGGESDAEGRFTVRGLPSGKLVVRGFHPRFVRASEELVLDGDRGSVELRFEAGAEIRGRVVDESGRPVEGARWSTLPTGIDDSMSGYGYGVTAADGMFVHGPAAVGGFTLEVKHEGFAVHRTLYEADSVPAGDLEVVLRRGGVLRGRVLGLDLDALAELQIQASGPAGVIQGRVDYDGGFEIANVSPGVWTVSAHRPRFGQHASAEVTVEEGADPAPVDLEFITGYRVSGIVRSLGAQESPWGTMAMLTHSVLGKSVSVAIDPSGRFRFEGVAGGTWELNVLEMGNPRHRRTLEVDGDLEIEIVPEGSTLSGRVVGPDGSPLAAVEVAVLATDGSPTGILGVLQRTAWTDAEGTFTVDGLPPGGWTLTLKKDGFAQRSEGIEMGAQPRSLELVLNPSSPLSFRVASTNGQPVRWLEWALAPPGGAAVASGYASMGSDGVYRLRDVPSGSYELWLQGSELGAGTFAVGIPGEAGPFTVSPGARLVLESPGQDAPRFFMRLTSADGRVHRWVSHQTGLVDRLPVVAGQTLTGLPEGTWRVDLVPIGGSAGESVSTGVTLAAGQEQRIQLPPSP
ncbi:MAG: carboxypeptidase regulatory-like domain-containing protein [Acidobacteriota bacterium]